LVDKLGRKLVDLKVLKKAKQLVVLKEKMLVASSEKRLVV